MLKRLFVCESLDDDGGRRGSRSQPAGARPAYRDHIFKADWLNGFMLQSNMALGWLYRNCINAPLLSHRTQTIKRLQEARKERDGGGVARPEVGPAACGLDVKAGALKLAVPPKLAYLYAFFMSYELFLILRFLLITFYLSDRFPKQTLVTASRPSGSLGYEALSFERPLDLMREAPKLLVRAGGELETSCLGELQDYLNKHYGRFYLWEASVGLLNGRNASALLFNSEQEEGRFQLILEENYAMQVIRREIKVYTYLIACFLITCFLGSLIATKIPYDITPVVLIYDPHLVAFTVKLRVCRYLGQMRLSYANFWSAYSLGPENELMYENQAGLEAGILAAVDGDLEDDDEDDDEEDDEEDEEEEDEEEEDEEEGRPEEQLDKQAGSRLLSCRNFRNYVPRVRSQSWRRVLMVLQPASYQSVLLFVICTIFGLWYLFVRHNSGATANNRRLKMFLQNKNDEHGDGPFELAHFRGLALECRSLLVESVDLGRVRHLLAQNYAHSLRNYDQRAYSLKLATYLNNSFPSQALLAARAGPARSGGDGAAAAGFWAGVDLQIVANTLAPLQMPKVHYWIMPAVCALLPCLMAALYLVILALTFLDLGIWLVELRLKLNICIALLRHYQQLVQARSPNSPPHADPPVWGAHGRPQLSPSWFVTTPTPSFVDPVSSTRLTARLTTFAFTDFQSRARNRRSKPAATTTFKPAKWACDGGGGELCNVKLAQIFTYMLANRREKALISERYARQLIGLDELGGAPCARKATRKFLVSTYLDFRLFLDQIDDCRNSINFFIGYTVGHALNIIAVSATLTGLIIQVSFVLAAFSLANLSLVGGGFFQSQCSKLYAPINSILALCLRGDRVVLHLASLWRRALTDLSGSRSKLSFRVYSLNISYALALQFNLSIVSLYIIILDRAKSGH